MRAMIGLSMLAVALAAVGAVMVVADPTEEQIFCNADELLVNGVPPGWEFERDRANNCEWTLFNGLGERAPAELYETVPLDPPPILPARSESQRLIGWFVVGLAGVALVASFLWPGADSGEDVPARDPVDAGDC